MGVLLLPATLLLFGGILPSIMLGIIFWVLFWIGMYVMYQTHNLPPLVAKFAGRALFYPSLPLTILARTFLAKGGHYTAIDDHVIIGAFPIAPLGHVEELKQLDVRGVVNMCDESMGPVDEYKKHDISQIYLASIDHIEPSLDLLKQAVDFIEETKKVGGKIYVHCKAGRGRSGAVLMCYLMKEHKKTPEEAQAWLNEKRSVRKTLFSQPNVLAFYNELK